MSKNRPNLRKVKDHNNTIRDAYHDTYSLQSPFDAESVAPMGTWPRDNPVSLKLRVRNDVKMMQTTSARGNGYVTGYV
jgi:hypothetical protein